MRGDAEAGLWRGERHPVQAVGPGEGQRGGKPELPQPHLLIHRLVI